MKRTNIVTCLVILSITATVGCRAKFKTAGKPTDAATNAAPTGGQPAANQTAPTAPGGQPSASTPSASAPSATPVAAGAPGKDAPAFSTGTGFPPGGQVIPTGPASKYQEPSEGPTPPTYLPPTSNLPKTSNCPTQEDASVDASRPVQRQTVVFKQGRQMVWRKNCAGQVFSKKFETMSHGAIMKRIQIRPVSAKGPMSVFNRTTCHATRSQHSIAHASTMGEYAFNVSLCKSNGAMVVKPGPNLIDYAIGNERGTLILDVRLDESDGGCTVIRAKGCRPDLSRDSFSALDQDFTSSH